MYSLGKSFLVVTKVIMRPNLGSRFLSSLFVKQFYFHLIYIYFHVRLNKETDFYFLTEIYFHHMPRLIYVGI
jgi:hypothetical protein